MSSALQLDRLAREWTVDDIDTTEWPEGYRYEIVDGALVVTPAPGPNHQIVSIMAATALNAALPTGFMAVGPLDLVMGRKNVREPDLVIAELSTLRRVKRLTPPDVLVAVEIVSPSSVTTDRITKPAQYAAAGIPFYWRVEPEPLSLTMYALEGAAYRETGSWVAGQLATITEPFPIELDIAALLPDA